MARVFFALWPPAAVAGQLADIARSAAARFGGKPTRQETIHLTLAFLGQVPETSLPSLIAAAADVRSPCFAFDIDHLGYWPNKHLLWAGGSAPSPVLEQLAGGLQSALTSAGFTVEASRIFSPHLTLLRKMPEMNRRLDLPLIAQVGWSCTGFVLVRSYLSTAGPEYRIIARFPFESSLA